MRADHKTWVVSCRLPTVAAGSHRKACRLPFFYFTIKQLTVEVPDIYHK